jgi:uncharacterized membrane protein YphA (DoxX/SURF4 family)
MEIVYLLGRILLGGYFLYNGYNHFANLDSLTGYAKSKNVPMAKEGVIVTGLMMIIGGATILTGLSMTIGLWILVVFLLVTSFMMHQFWNVTDPMAKMGEEINFTKNIALAGALLVILAM